METRYGTAKVNIRGTYGSDKISRDLRAPSFSSGNDLSNKVDSIGKSDVAEDYADRGGYASENQTAYRRNPGHNKSRLTGLLLALTLATPASLSAQSLIFPEFLDKHWPHALTKPAISLPLMIGFKEIGVPKTLSIIGGLALPEVITTIRSGINYPEFWMTGAAWKDRLADTWAAAAWSVPWQLKGNWKAFGLNLPKKWTTLVGMTLIYTGLPPKFKGLNRWSLP